MFISTSQIKIFLYRHTIDERWGMDRLFALVDSELHLDPMFGTLFVFFNWNRSLARVAYYDESGSCSFISASKKACSNIQISMKTGAPVKSRLQRWHCFWKVEI
jgi:hypothetical protein